MWVAKIKLIDDKCIWATRCKKFGVYNFQYPLGFYESGHDLNFVSYHILEGNSTDIKSFFREAKKDKRVVKLNSKNNFAISLVVEGRGKGESEAFKTLYNQKLIYLKPGVNYPDGYEVWEVGSFDRKDVEKTIKYMEKYYYGELLSLKELKVPKIFVPQIMPGLTDKQEKAFKMASDEGYYEFPRKTNLHKLARLSKISRPTFNEHLRKAEIKLLRFLKNLFSR